MTAPHPFDGLDARALRDLGLDRSELSSLAAEAEGRAAPSRRRVVPVRAATAVPRRRPRLRAIVSGWGTRLLAAVAAIVAVAAVSAGVRHTARDAFGVAAHPRGADAAASTAPHAGAGPAYFPDQFPPPDGEIEPLPSQF